MLSWSSRAADWASFLKAAQGFVVARLVLREHFHGDDAVEHRVEGTEHGPHPAAADDTRAARNAPAAVPREVCPFRPEEAGRRQRYGDGRVFGDHRPLGIEAPANRRTGGDGGRFLGRQFSRRTARRISSLCCEVSTAGSPTRLSGGCSIRDWPESEFMAVTVSRTIEWPRGFLPARCKRDKIWLTGRWTSSARIGFRRRKLGEQASDDLANGVPAV